MQKENLFFFSVTSAIRRPAPQKAGLFIKRTSDMEKQKVIVYVDGFNFYHVKVNLLFESGLL